MEVYQTCDSYSVSSVKEIINVILKIAESDKTCDDLFTVKVDYSSAEEGWYEYVDGLVEDTIDSEEALYKEFQEVLEEGTLNEVAEFLTLRGIEFMSLEDFTEDHNSNASSGYSAHMYECSLILEPKSQDPLDKETIRTLDKINSLFSSTACSNY